MQLLSIIQLAGMARPAAAGLRLAGVAVGEHFAPHIAALGFWLGTAWLTSQRQEVLEAGRTLHEPKDLARKRGLGGGAASGCARGTPKSRVCSRAFQSHSLC